MSILAKLLLKVKVVEVGAARLSWNAYSRSAENGSEGSLTSHRDLVEVRSCKVTKSVVRTSDDSNGDMHHPARGSRVRVSYVLATVDGPSIGLGGHRVYCSTKIAVPDRHAPVVLVRRGPRDLALLSSKHLSRRGAPKEERPRGMSKFK